MINLVRFIFDAQAPVSDGGLVCFEVYRGRSDLVVARSPGDLLAIGPETRPAARNIEVNDIRAMRFNQQYAVVPPHSRMHSRHNPFAVARPAGVVEVMQVSAVNMRLDLTAG